MEAINRYGEFTYNYSIRPDEISIGHIVKQAGYRTAHFGKWHLGTQPQFHPQARGFDEFYGFLAGGFVSLIGFMASVLLLALQHFIPPSAYTKIIQVLFAFSCGALLG